MHREKKKKFLLFVKDDMKWNSQHILNQNHTKIWFPTVFIQQQHATEFAVQNIQRNQCSLFTEWMILMNRFFFSESKTQETSVVRFSNEWLLSLLFLVNQISGICLIILKCKIFAVSSVL